MANKTLYPEDRTGTLASNKVQETQVITPINNRNFHFFVPRHAPFYEDGFKIFQNINGTLLPLEENKDYYFCYKYESACLSTAKNVWGGIGLLNLIFTGELTLEYQTVGGNWVLDDTEILEIVANEVYNPRGRTWDQTTNKPLTFGPTTHIQNADDFLTQQEVGEKLHDIAQAILDASTRPIARPPVTLEDLGIPKIGNWGMANINEAVAGESTVTIINPLTLKAVLSHYGLLNVSQELGDFRLHIQDKNNPHETDKNSVELNKVENRGVAPNEDVLANRDNEGLISLTQLKTYLRTHGCVTAPEGEPTYPEKGALLSYRCTSNYDRIGLFADGMGHTYEKIVEPNSLECGYKAPEKNNYPPHGTILQYYCLDFDRWKIVADGYGGSYHVFVMANSNDCGFNGPGGTTTFPPAGTLLSAHCDRTTLVQTLANGAGGSYENRIAGHTDCASNTTYPPRGTLVSTFCENKNEIGKYTDGAGGYYEAVLVQNSIKCGYVQPTSVEPVTHPPRGTPLGNECRGFTFVNKFADGSGGVYTEIVEANSPRCGYVTTSTTTTTKGPSCPPRGTHMGDGCEGNNYVIKYADGNCGTYSTISEYNSSRCGGSTPGPTGSPRPTDPPRNLTVTYSSDRQFLTTTTGVEHQTVKITGGASNTTYFLTLWNRVEGGTICTGHHARVQTDSAGNYTFNLNVQAPSNPQLTPDGQYECWAELRTIQGSASYVAKSNSIFRSFSGLGYNTGRRNAAFGITNPNMAQGISPWFVMVFTGFGAGENLGWEMVFKPDAGGREAAIFSGYVRANNNGYCIVEYTPSDQGIPNGPSASSIFPDGGYSVYVRVGTSKSNTNNFSSYTGSSLQISNSRFA